MQPHQLPIGRYIRLRGGYRVSKEDNWQESLDVKNSMYRVEPAQHESHCLDCPANPNRWVCSACVSWAQNGICKHVLAVTHVLEAEKPAEEQDHRLNLKRLLLALPRVKDKKGKGRARGGGAGYRMITGALQPQLRVGSCRSTKGRTREGRARGTSAGKKRRRRGRDEESSDSERDDEDGGATGRVNLDWQVDYHHTTCYAIPLNAIPAGAIPPWAIPRAHIHRPAILRPQQPCAAPQSRRPQSCPTTQS